MNDFVTVTDPPALDRLSETVARSLLAGAAS